VRSQAGVHVQGLGQGLGQGLAYIAALQHACSCGGCGWMRRAQENGDGDEEGDGDGEGAGGVDLDVYMVVGMWMGGST